MCVCVCASLNYIHVFDDELLLLVVLPMCVFIFTVLSRSIFLKCWLKGGTAAVCFLSFLFCICLATTEASSILVLFFVLLAAIRFRLRTLCPCVHVFVLR